MREGKESKMVKDTEHEDELKEKERERERERARSAEMVEITHREKEIKHKSEKETQRKREVEKEKEKIVLMDVQNEAENNVVVVHKARKKLSNPSSSVTSSRSVSPVPLYPGSQIPSQAVCLSLQSSQKMNPESSRSNRELLLLQRKQGGADRKQSSADNIVEMRNGRSDGMRNEEVDGGTMDSHPNTIHHPLSQSNNRVKSNQNSAYKLHTKETHKQRDDDYPTDGEGGSDVDVLADSLVPIKDLQLHLALFGNMIDGLNTEVENTDLEGSESFGLDCMYLRNKKIETNKIPHVPKEKEIEKENGIIKEKEKETEKENEIVKIEVDKYDIEIKNDHRQPHSRLKQMLLANDDRDTFDLLQDTLSLTPDAHHKEKDKEKEKEKIEDLQRLLKPSTSAFSMGNMAVNERDLGSEYQKKESRRNSYQSNLAQPVRKDRGPVISGGVGLLKNLEIESNMSNISSRRASTGSDGGVWSEVPADRGAGGRPSGSAHLKQSLPPSIHDLLRVSPPDECDTGREREREERGREERGREERGREERGREERGREERGREERGHAEEKQEEERARKLLNDKEKERDKIRSIERDRDRELSRERADVVDYGLVARKKEKEQKEQERLLLREAEREKSKEWEREKVKQARERLKKDAEEEERHQQLIQERIPQNPDPRSHHGGRNERGEGGSSDNQIVTGIASGIATGGRDGGGGGGGERDVRRGAGREKEEIPRRDRERVETVTMDRKKGPGKPDERGAVKEKNVKEEDEESLLVAELLALERRQKTTLRIEDTQKKTESGIQPPSSKDSDKIKINQGRESQLPRGKSLARSESTPRPTRSEGVKEKEKEKVAFGPGARDVRKPDNKSAAADAPVMSKSKSVAAVSAGSRGKEKEKEEERERERNREMERAKEREREQGTVKREPAGVKPVAQPDLVHLKAWTPAQDEVDNDEEYHSPVSRNGSANGTKGKMKKIMPDIQENQPAIEEGGGYLLEYRKKHADKEKEKGGAGGGGGGKVLRRRHSDMHQQGQGDMGREREREREEYGGESPNVMHVSSGTQSLGHKHDRRVVSKSRVTEEDSLSLPPILPASVALEGSGRHPMDKKRNRSGGTASAPSRLRHDAATSLRATPGFEPEAPILPNPIRVSHDYGSPNGHSPILQNNSRVGKKIPVR
jgi:hypothetical protein